MKKLLIASAVSAALAAPTVALAQAARAPTLGQVLEASGLDVSGYLDAGYSYNNRNVETGGFSDRVFDSQNNSFALHQFGLQVAKQPKQGFGGVVNITVGADAQVIHAFPETTNPAGSMFDITQAYGQYASGPLTLMAGKFVTLAGSEVIWSPSNNNFSHSILFGAIPFTLMPEASSTCPSVGTLAACASATVGAASAAETADAMRSFFIWSVLSWVGKVLPLPFISASNLPGCSICRVASGFRPKRPPPYSPDPDQRYLVSLVLHSSRM